MRLQYTETEGGEWKDLILQLRMPELEERLKRMAETAEEGACLVIDGQQFHSLKLPDGRIFSSYFKKFNHEVLNQTFVALTKTQKKLVELLKSEDRVFYRNEIIEKIWGNCTSPINLNVSMFLLKKKVPNLILSSRGVAGWKLNRGEAKKYFLNLKGDMPECGIWKES